MLIAVTGGLGFIGRHVVTKLINRGDYVYLIDNETYAAQPRGEHSQVRYVKSDIATLEHLPDVQAIINLAAETHVDNSLHDSRRFVHSNVLGVQNLLELCRAKRQYEIPLFIQISTDEVYGSVLHGTTKESAPLQPSSPYAASKAAADMLVQAWGHSYNVPWRIIRPSNCYGIGQYPEKLIPKAIRCMQLGKAIPIHEAGKATRSWLWVEDCADAILTVLDKGANGEIYNVPGNTERSVYDIGSDIVKEFNANATPADFLDLGYVRVGLDKRYCVSGEKLLSLGWTPKGNLNRDLPKIVEEERLTFRW